jgi:hypothetical protein
MHDVKLQTVAIPLSQKSDFLAARHRQINCNAKGVSAVTSGLP